MKNLFHALWHPFLHFRALRWFARRGRWLLVMVPLAFTLQAGLDSLGHPVAANVVFDLLVVRLMIVVIESIFSIPRYLVDKGVALVPSDPFDLPVWVRPDSGCQPIIWYNPETGANTASWSPGCIQIN
ncbi:hypothetical protein WL80_24540 [Burkholderia ubonensis]|uniref:hypothetical protein n=1 Tax=Burkholderia ubonensis TaxID=101571 RepID=UPI00075955CC|nr:hypothetical protein [Burkholderia ubonensis]KWE83371.1 hypothetical protein WL80_24540 [Burkholderia ubonensis]OJA35237.1 hypothetical protein BGV47_20685 [Burkholderia ubonensis]OJB28807.1 hypothetical protein BGV55_16995 [Burkholderia ubonensis]